MNKYHEVEKVLFKEDMLILKVDGKNILLHSRTFHRDLPKPNQPSELLTKFLHQVMAFIGRSWMKICQLTACSESSISRNQGKQR